jgi:penicillin-binding protein 1B
MTNLMQEVLATGTAAGVRERYNLDFPAAGKTGTSDHDGWFAGYTSNLLCVVWVGFDDNRELDLEGAHSAAPIWAEFMKRALQLREYRDPKPFDVPGGIVSIAIDPESGMPATSNCPHRRTEVYIAGTEPIGSCPLHGGRQVTNVAGWETTTAGPARPAPGAELPSSAGAAAESGGAPPAVQLAKARAPAAAPPPPAPAQPQPKKGFWSRLLRVFK